MAPTILLRWKFQNAQHARLPKKNVNTWNSCRNVCPVKWANVGVNNAAKCLDGVLYVSNVGKSWTILITKMLEADTTVKIALTTTTIDSRRWLV